MNPKTVQELSAGGIVYREKNNSREWLVIQHAGAKHWGFPKGHIGDKVKNEKIEEAALREVEEEGGIKATILLHTPITTTYYFKVKDSIHRKTVHYFLMRYVSGKTEDHDWEVLEAKFVSENEVKEIVTYKSDKEAFETTLQLLNTWTAYQKCQL